MSAVPEKSRRVVEYGLTIIPAPTALEQAVLVLVVLALLDLVPLLHSSRPQGLLVRNASARRLISE